MMRFYSTKNNNIPVVDWPKVLGRKGGTLTPYRLTSQIIKEGNPITAAEVNRVLSFTQIQITQQRLEELLNRSRLEFTNLDSNTIKSDYFLKNIGTYRGVVQIPGVYIWTYLPTGDKYVGSSSKLAQRLIGYFNCSHKDTGKLIPLIKKEGVNAFNLQVIPIADNYTKYQEQCLEQYFLLHPEFTLNTLRISNSITGGRAKPLYMYTKDFSRLIYSSGIQEDFIFKLGIHHTIFSKSIKTGETYLDKYIFTDYPVLDAIENELSLTEVLSLLSQDRAEAEKAKGRKIILKDMHHENDIKEFDSIRGCVRYLNTKAPSSKTTLYRHIESGRPYHGYYCQWAGSETPTMFDKTIQVGVSHISSNLTEIYPSFKEAAKSFSPEYTTSEQTLKDVAEKGLLFNNEYKITVITNPIKEIKE